MNTIVTASGSSAAHVATNTLNFDIFFNSYRGGGAQR